MDGCTLKLMVLQKECYLYLQKAPRDQFYKSGETVFEDKITSLIELIDDSI